MKLFNKVKTYVYFVTYISGFSFGNIEIFSPTKLDSFKELNKTRETIAKTLGKESNEIIIINFILQRKEYRDKWW